MGHAQLLPRRVGRVREEVGVTQTARHRRPLVAGTSRTGFSLVRDVAAWRLRVMFHYTAAGVLFFGFLPVPEILRRLWRGDAAAALPLSLLVLSQILVVFSPIAWHLVRWSRRGVPPPWVQQRIESGS